MPSSKLISEESYTMNLAKQSLLLAISIQVRIQELIFFYEHGWAIKLLIGYLTFY